MNPSPFFFGLRTLRPAPTATAAGTERLAMIGTSSASARISASARNSALSNEAVEGSALITPEDALADDALIRYKILPRTVTTPYQVLAIDVALVFLRYWCVLVSPVVA